MASKYDPTVAPELPAGKHARKWTGRLGDRILRFVPEHAEKHAAQQQHTTILDPRAVKKIGEARCSHGHAIML